MKEGEVSTIRHHNVTLWVVEAATVDTLTTITRKREYVDLGNLLAAGIDVIVIVTKQAEVTVKLMELQDEKTVVARILERDFGEDDQDTCPANPSVTLPRMLTRHTHFDSVAPPPIIGVKRAAQAV